MNATKKILALTLSLFMTVSSFQFSGLEVKASELTDIEEVNETEIQTGLDDTTETEEEMESSIIADEQVNETNTSVETSEEETADVVTEDSELVIDDAEDEELLKEDGKVKITFVFGHETGSDPVM